MSFISNFLLSRCQSLGMGGVFAIHVPSNLEASIGSQNGTLLTKATNSRWGNGGFLASLRMQTSGVAAWPSSNTQPPAMINICTNCYYICCIGPVHWRKSSQGNSVTEQWSSDSDREKTSPMVITQPCNSAQLKKQNSKKCRDRKLRCDLTGYKNSLMNNGWWVRGIVCQLISPPRLCLSITLWQKTRLLS